MPPVPKKWRRNPSDDLAVQQGCTFDAAAGERVCHFLETFCRQSKGQKWSGQPLQLMPWQRDFIMRLYSWKRPDRTRRFRTFYLEVPKKSGKSTMLSGLCLNAAIADDEPGAEVYICAYDRSQASIVFDEAANMVAKSPSLSRILDVIKSNKRIVHPPSASKIQALSADVPSKDGPSSSFTVFDELHRQRTPALWDIMRYAGAARDQPLLGAITTAGFDRTSICYRQHDITKKINEGIIQNTSHLGVIYGAEQTDDIEDPAVWRRANPSLGVTIKEEDFRIELAEALNDPTQLNNFLRLRLNIWTQADSRYLARDAWDACDLGPISPEALRDRPCYGGLDLSTTVDLSAWILIFPRPAGGFDLLCQFWAPEEGAEHRQERDRVPYLTWARQGFLTLTPGAVIDYEHIRAHIKRDAARFDIRKICVDPWNATQIITALRETDGLPIEFLRQGFASLTGPTKEFSRLVASQRLNHGGNPVLNWMADNAVAEEDAAGNVKLSKARSTERIDGISATVCAIAAASDEIDEGTSVYDTRGLLVI